MLSVRATMIAAWPLGPPIGASAGQRRAAGELMGDGDEL
jgi:hypothetical protein